MIFLVIAGASNAVNLTDGLDGLAAGCCAIVLLAYTAITFITTGEHSLSLLSACLVGGCVGFLWFNTFPHRSSWVTPAPSASAARSGRWR